LVSARWVLEIFADPHVEPAVAQNFERLARGAAHRIVINCCLHLLLCSRSGFKELNKHLTHVPGFLTAALSRLRNDEPQSSFLRCGMHPLALASTCVHAPAA